MMIRMEGDVYQKHSLTKRWLEWTEKKKHPPQGFSMFEPQVVEPCCPLLGGGGGNPISSGLGDGILQRLPDDHVNVELQIKHVTSK